jgi:TatD DNase family protein
VIDIGANLTDKSFADDLDDVLARARAAGLEGIVVTGTSLDSSRRAVDLARRHRTMLSATAGIHPHDAKAVDGPWIAELTALASAIEVVAIGETGLDFNRNYSPAAAQRRAFGAQIELAAEMQLPLFVHDRDTAGETADMLEHHGSEVPGIVIHCFTGSESELQRYLEAGYYVGITGWVCDERRGTGLRSLVTLIPADRLLIETDSPYLMPRTIEPRPQTRRNEPANLTWVAKELADIRGVPVEQLAAATASNARRLFNLRL